MTYADSVLDCPKIPYGGAVLRGVQEREVVATPEGCRESEVNGHIGGNRKSTDVSEGSAPDIYALVLNHYEVAGGIRVVRTRVRVRTRVGVRARVRVRIRVRVRVKVRIRVSVSVRVRVRVRVKVDVGCSLQKRHQRRPKKK